jgi:RNA polymerase sigma-70 factor (ECF subfamily)
MTTKELIKNCLEENRQAQELLYLQYADTMMGVCYRYTKSTADAEDVLQEGFIKVFTKLHQFKNEGDLGAWIRRIMVNTAISYLNKHNRYKREMQIEAITMHPVVDNGPEISIDTKQLVELIRTLPAGYQTIFNLVAVEGYSLIEISNTLDINENTVRSKYSRARSMLITLLKTNDLMYETKNYANKF